MIVANLRAIIGQVKHLRVAIILPDMVDLVVFTLQEVDEVGAFDAVEVLYSGLRYARLLNIDDILANLSIINAPSDRFVLLRGSLLLK